MAWEAFPPLSVVRATLGCGGRWSADENLKSHDRDPPAMKTRDVAPDALVVFCVQKKAACARCGRDDESWYRLLPNDSGGQDAVCMTCSGLDDLVFMPMGDPRLTRRTKAHSTRSAALVSWARARKRYEREGWLVEPHAIEAALHELAAEGYEPKFVRHPDGSWWTTGRRARPV